MQYRLFNKSNSSIFDLIGTNEPSQTKALGYLLARSHLAMEGLLELIYPGKDNKKFRADLLMCSQIIDCEEREESGIVDSLRSDIVIRFQRGFKPNRAIIIEAKGIGVKADERKAQVQAQNYSVRFNALSEYKDKVDIVSLTKFISLSSDNGGGAKKLRWQDIQKKLYDITLNKQNRYYYLEKELIEDFLHYLNYINGAMKFYNEEVLIIPASKTLDSIETDYFYQCLAGTRHDDARANSHPLYVAFAKNSIVKKLYKILDIVKMSFSDDSAIAYITQKHNHLTRESFTQCWQKLKSGYDALPPDKKEKAVVPEHDRWVFVLDNNNSIILPKEVKIGWHQNHTFRSLQEMLNPNSNCLNK